MKFVTCNFLKYAYRGNCNGKRLKILLLGPKKTEKAVFETIWNLGLFLFPFWSLSDFLFFFRWAKNWIQIFSKFKKYDADS